ncbi:uncharacterized protein [Eurosta solidaginis]|uniref:uncharacterized protein n=1 Tax=Eurosta solidaginis TaxID=178769 RepID=UPI0035309E78
MKAFALTVTILCLAVAHGFVDYQLKCNHDEVGIRWPSYHSNSDYYVCTRIGGKQIKMSCNAGELFTFVLQACTEPGKFIPPPPTDILPISSLNQLPSSEQQTGLQVVPVGNTAVLPKPLHPAIDSQSQINLSPQMPPIIIDENSKPPNLESSVHGPPHESSNGGQEEIIDGLEEPAPVMKPSPPNKQKPAQMPPTPEPTPPVVKKPQSIAKKPPIAGKNKPQAKPTKKPASGARKHPKPPTKHPKH